MTHPIFFLDILIEKLFGPPLKKWYRWYYPHWLRDSVSPVCEVFFKKEKGKKKQVFSRVGNLHWKTFLKKNYERKPDLKFESCDYFWWFLLTTKKTNPDKWNSFLASFRAFLPPEFVSTAFYNFGEISNFLEIQNVMLRFKNGLQEVHIVTQKPVIVDKIPFTLHPWIGLIDTNTKKKKNRHLKKGIKLSFVSYRMETNLYVFCSPPKESVIGSTMPIALLIFDYLM